MTGTRRIINDGCHPKRAVTCRRACGTDAEDELDILPHQRGEVNIGCVILSFIPFNKGPEGLDVGTAYKRVIEAEDDIAGGGAVLTVDDGAKLIAALHFICGINTLDVPVVDVLRMSNQTRAIVVCAVFQSRGVGDQHKAIRISIGTGTGLLSRSTEP